jgi:hypothetical protein
MRDQTASGRAWVTEARADSDGNDVVEVDVSTGSRTGRRVHVPGFPRTVTPARDGTTLWVSYYQYGPGQQISWRDNHARAVLVALDIETGDVTAEMHNVLRAGVSNQGRLVTADYEGGIEERDPRTLEPIATLAGTRGLLEWLAFSSDGSLLIAAGDEGTVQLYDSVTWTRLGEIPSAAPEDVPEGWLRPDGRAVAVNTEHAVVEWTLDPELLAAAACELAGRNLTRAEWATYLPDQAYRRTCPDYPAGA